MRLTGHAVDDAALREPSAVLDRVLDLEFGGRGVRMQSGYSSALLAEALTTGDAGNSIRSGLRPQWMTSSSPLLRGRYRLTDPFTEVSLGTVDAQRNTVKLTFEQFQIIVAEPIS